MDWNCNGTITPATVANNGKVSYTTESIPFPTGFNYATNAAKFYTDLLNPDSSYYAACNFTAAQRQNFAIKRFGAAMAAQTGGGFYKDDPTGVLSALAQLSTFVSLVSEGFQLDRDRTYGFVAGVSAPGYAPAGYEPKTGLGWWNSSTGTVPYGSTGNGSVIYPNVGCDPYIFMGGESPLTNVKLSDGSIANLTVGTTGGAPDQGIAFALSICSTVSSTVNKPKYPALYYLFPKANHRHDGTKTATGGTQVLQNTADAYVTDPYTQAVNTGYSYRVIEDLGTLGNGDGDADSDEAISEFASYLGVIPRTPSSWSTPVSDTAAGRVNTITYNGIPYYPAFLDVGIFNSREQMSTRVLSIDLDLMRQRRVGLGSSATTFCTANDPTSAAEKTATATKDQNGLCWLPLPTLMEGSGGVTSTGALIYAFREDAVREDAIARPTRADASNLTCDADTTLGTADDERWTQAAKDYTGATADSSPANGKADLLETNASGLDAADFLMDAVGTNGTNYYDPPLNPCTGVSPKPVDFYADPDRRPHGFALRNGADLRRKTSATAFDKEHRPFTFVTDNLAYIWGNFNLHSTDGTIANSPVQEFKGTSVLASDWNNFYSRSDLNNDFADAEDNDGDNVIDTWRVAEIVADGVTVLHSGFTPGFIAQGLMWDTENTNYARHNSYGGMHILRTSSGTDGANTTEANDTKTTREGWRLENGGTTGTTALNDLDSPNDLASPLLIDRNGLPVHSSMTVRSSLWLESATNNNTRQLKKQRIPRPDATIPLTLNALLASSISPSRAYHGYGGLHNFTRLIEN